MSQFSFISWNYKNILPSIYSHFLLHLISVQTFEVNFPESADSYVTDTNTIVFFTAKLIPLKYFGF